MRKYIIIFFITFFFYSIVHADTVFFIGDGDSIGHGFNGYTNPACTAYYPGNAYQDGFWPYLVTDLGGGLTYFNGGVDGYTAASVVSHLAAELAAHTCGQYYLHVGINDITGSVTLSTYLSNIDSIRASVQATGAEFLINQILPSTYYGSEPYTSTIKLWNAALEDWCRTNNIRMVGIYQDFCTTDPSTENINTAYCCDTLHPDQSGYSFGSSLMAHPAIPARKRVWGASSYPSGPSYISWKWLVLAGTASISLDADKGDLVLAQNDSAQGTVECLPTGSKTININAQMRSGASVIYYRTAATTNFFRNNSSISWTAYTTPPSITDQFIQVKVSNTSATPAVIKNITLTWSGSVDTTEADIDPIAPSNGFGISGGGVHN